MIASSGGRQDEISAQQSEADGMPMALFAAT